MILRRIWRECLHGERAKIAIIFVLMVLIAISSAGYAQAIQWIIAAFDGNDASVTRWGPALVIALVMTKALSQYGQQILTAMALTEVQRGLQLRLFKQLIEMDLAALTSENSAAQATRFSNDIEVAKLALSAFFSSVTSILTVIATIIYMLSVDAWMTLGLVLVFGIAFGPVGMVGNQIRGISRATQEQIGTMARSVNESLSSIRMVRTYQLEARLTESASKIFLDLRRLRLRLTAWQAIPSPLMEVLGGVAVAALLVMVAIRINNGAIDLAAFVGLLTALGVITSPARRLGQHYANAAAGLAAFERIFQLFDADNRIQSGGFKFPQGEKARGEITFEEVGFSYPGKSEQVLRDINLHIPAGATYAFVGQSGAGKSTIFNLLTRLYDVGEGRLSLDDQRITAYDLGALRNQIAVVSQESVILHGTIIENIRLGRRDATREEVKKAAEAAAANEFIEALKDGYDTLLDPTKMSLSGGERQRISIARAILRDAPILLLDEPTSALDSTSESVIRQALEEFEKGRTTLVIAHRLSTILHADQIIVMDGGAIVDQGTHAELLARGGIYAELFELQFNTEKPVAKRGAFRRATTPTLETAPDDVSWFGWLFGR